VSRLEQFLFHGINSLIVGVSIHPLTKGRNKTMHSSIFRIRLAGLGLAGLLATGSIADAETVQLKADLKGATATATGNATVTYDTANKQVTWRITYSGLSGPPDCRSFPWPGAARGERRRCGANPERCDQPGAGIGDADRCPGGRPAGGPLLHQCPYGRQSCRRDPRASHQVNRSLVPVRG
jgi:hypothetical protein